MSRFDLLAPNSVGVAGTPLDRSGSSLSVTSVEKARRRTTSLRTDDASFCPLRLGVFIWRNSY